MQSATPGEAGTALDASASPSAPRIHVLKHADTFAVCDSYGDILGRSEQVGARVGSDGLFQDDTRILSRFVLTLGDVRPVLLGSNVSRDNALLVVDLTNPPLVDAAGTSVATGTLHVRRSRFLWARRMYEEVRVRSYVPHALRVPVEINFGADFRDLFEVRGAQRAARGTTLAGTATACAVSLGYRGRDGQARTVWLETSEPAVVEEGWARFMLELPPQGEAFLMLAVGTERLPGGPPDRPGHRSAAAAARRAIRRTVRRGARIDTSNQMFDRWLGGARTDLALLLTDLETGPYPYAGIPWFSTPFGRDAIITALEVLWLDPAIARGVLGYLAARQATEVSAFQDAEPGKIMHETRRGEMAVLGEVPFLLYYGGVDTTPLFVMLAAAYYTRTADLAFIDKLWPSIEAALAWVDGYGDADGDGFVEYARHLSSGLANQGWKDSHDSVFHADGSEVEGPIALCEVQGYVYAARQGAADLAEALGEGRRAQALRRQAAALAERFNRTFWAEDLGTYVLALDGDKRPCRVRTSNIGHLLFCGIVPPERAERVAAQLVGSSLFSGWGVRTVASGEIRYNPMSYHNGSIWPHDTAIAAGGLGRYGHTAQAARLLDALFDAAAGFEDFRLPELFCGFPRHAGEAPTSYPVACLPQAWATGAVYLLLQACLGISLDASRRCISVTRPALPPTIGEVVIRNLELGGAHASLGFRAVGNGVEATLRDITGDLTLEVRAQP